VAGSFCSCGSVVLQDLKTCKEMYLEYMHSF
jgi:hypothetical protein